MTVPTMSVSTARVSMTTTMSTVMSTVMSAVVTPATPAAEKADAYVWSTTIIPIVIKDATTTCKRKAERTYRQ